jgi:predicted MFS family arabinose efflux permease
MERIPLWPILAMGLVQLLRMGGVGAVATFFNVYLDQVLALGTATIGAITSVGTLLAAPAALLMPVVAARWGKPGTFASMTAGGALFVALLALVPHPAVAAASQALYRALAVIGMSAGNIYRVELVEPRWQGAMAGAANMGMGVGSFAISLAGGHIVTRHGYGATFLVGAAMLMASAALLAGFAGTHDRGKRAWSSKEAGRE